ncbi:Hypothetical predicted protein [Mytilus galloprovincialis]|uniref:Uncharacterized protein n=1 Tax=Mytilus galloprovincialis TaxID=29158 RepID=A0A8B6EDV6_MYTGA|nr:Hypothetical predicted protein [Mytilus galloprovincialis]
MIIGITEVKPKNSAYKLNPAEFNLDLIDNYDLFSINIDSDKGRGKHEKKLSTNAKKNPKAIWKYIKSKSKTRSGIGELLTDQNDETSRKTDDDKEKAEILATFFNSVFTKEPEGEVPYLTK